MTAPGYRPLTARELDAWLRNWAAWLGESAECLPAFEVSDGTSSPQHWDAPLPEEMHTDAYEIPAAQVESIVHSAEFQPEWRAAVTAEYYHWPDRLLQHVPAEHWIGKRAARAKLPPKVYAHSLDLGCARLASILGRFRGLLPT